MEELMKNVIDEVQSRLWDVTAEPWLTIKNNGVETNGIVLRSKNGGSIAPIVYIDDLIDHGLTAYEIAEYVSNAWYDHKNPEVGSLIEDLSDFQKIRDGLSLRLVSLKLNQKEIENYIYWKYLDLAIILVYRLEDSYIEGQEASIKVTKQLAKGWDASKQELYSQAYQNFKRENSKCLNMLDTLKESGVEVGDVPDLNMMILTNESGLYGATRILDKEVLNFACEEFASDIILIPSSVHEFIIIPYNNYDTETLEFMINDVNASHLKKSEILSDHAYLYIRKENRVIGY